MLDLKFIRSLCKLEDYIYYDGIFNLLCLQFNIRFLSRLENIKNTEYVIAELKRLGYFVFDCGNKMLYVGRIKGIIDKYKGLFCGDKDYRLLGMLLGYPNCCINKYIEYGGIKDVQMYDYLNNIVKNKENGSIYLDFLGNKLIYHIPCSMNCKESVKIGKKSYFIYTLLNKVKRQKEKNLKSLKYVFFKNLDWICLDDYDNICGFGNYYNKKDTHFVKEFVDGYEKGIFIDSIKTFCKNGKIYSINKDFLFFRFFC